jgi:type III restriction enzyme
LFELKAFQEKAVSQLIKQSRGLIQSAGTDLKFVFKSPTGSGKTIMTAEYLQRLSGEDWASNLVYVWVSLYDLHNQSKAKLKNYLSDSQYSLKTLDELSDDALKENTILFVNWHSLTTQKVNPETNSKEWANLFVKDREDGKSIVSVLEKTRRDGKQLILIVDEAHRNYLTPNSQSFISEIFQPKMTLEVSATPLLKIDAEDIATNKAGFVGVSFSDAVSSGLIKQETIINQDVGKLVDLANSADDLVISAAIEKRNELQLHYGESGSSVNPLCLIQLPSETERTSALDLTVREQVERLLGEKGITYENGKLAVWLSEEKKNLDLIEKNNSQVEVLIFKEAVAIGWDCPRAQVLVMLRAIRSLTFEIQTVGRILRTPEAFHYKNDVLNKAFVFTNIAGININDRPEDLDFFKTKVSHLKSKCTGLELPSQYLHRQDYGDLTASFSKLMVEALNFRFGITNADTVGDAYHKADKELELYPEELKMPILSDVIVQNIDSIQKELGNFDIQHIQANVSDANIQKEFDYLLKAWCLPYAPVRSFSKIKTGFYKWFSIIGYPTSKWNEVQRIVACSAVNQNVFSEVISQAKQNYEILKPEEEAGRKEITDSEYSPPTLFMAGEKHESAPLKKYGYDPAFLLENRSDPERKFEALVDSSEKVDWWIKNGEGQQKFFSIVYGFVDAESGLNRRANFFPDYLVRFLDGSVGIYETKSGITLTDYLTYAKSDALQSFIAENSNLNLRGGIVNSTSAGLTIFTKAKYNPKKTEWDPVVL